MHCLSEEQIDFILDDIRARGIELEDLQSNLLDHVCCIIEENLKEGDDFERFYFEIIKQFFKKDLFEIEEETISLLTFKHYYTMKNIMIKSGAISAILSFTGILMKLFQVPGASPTTLIGIAMFSFVFLPLLFILKAREEQALKDKFVLSLGTLGGMVLSLGVLFKLMHWPFASIIGFSAVGILLLLFLPIYFISGIRNPSTKINTAVTSILLIAGCGLFLSLVTAKRSHWTVADEMRVFTRNELMLKNEQRQVLYLTHKPSADSTQVAMGRKLFLQCEDLKGSILEHETGFRTLDSDFEKKNIILPDESIEGYFATRAGALDKLLDLRTSLLDYNQHGTTIKNIPFIALPIESSILDHSEETRFGFSTVLVNLNFISQIQLLLLQNEMELIVFK
jgi:hypothetical protein